MRCRTGPQMKSCWSIVVASPGCEGIGVYMQQRWAELLMVFATASLIPIEIRHLWHRPGLVGALILLANCFIVWFLYQVLKREKPDAQIARQRELVETV